MAWRPLSLLVLWVLLVPDGLCFEIDMEILGALDKVLDKIEDNGSPQPPIDPVDDASSERKATRFRVDESGTPMAVDSEQQQQQQQQRRSAAQECEEFEPEDLVLPDEEEEGNDFADNDSEDLLDQGSAQQRLPAASISETSKDSSLDAAFAELDTEFDSAASPRQTKAGRKKSRRERALDGARKRRSKDMSKTAYVAANVDAFAGSALNPDDPGSPATVFETSDSSIVMAFAYQQNAYVVDRNSQDIMRLAHPPPSLSEVDPIFNSNRQNAKLVGKLFVRESGAPVICWLSDSDEAASRSILYILLFTTIVQARAQAAERQKEVAICLDALCLTKIATPTPQGQQPWPDKANPSLVLFQDRVAVPESLDLSLMPQDTPLMADFERLEDDLLSQAAIAEKLMPINDIQPEYDLAFEVSYQAHKLNGETKTQFQARVTASMDNLRIPRHGDPDAQQEPPPRGLHDVFFVVAGEDALIDWPEFSASFVAKMPAGQKKWNSEQIEPRNKFLLLDTDGDGRIDLHELHNGISVPGVTIDLSDELLNIFAGQVVPAHPGSPPGAAVVSPVSIANPNTLRRHGLQTAGQQQRHSRLHRGGFIGFLENVKEFFSGWQGPFSLLNFIGYLL